MPTPELIALIECEVRRVLIQNHSNFDSWYIDLGGHAQQVVDSILEEDVTAELILFADQAPREEWDTFLFLRIIAGGNPDPEVSSLLTNNALGEILNEVRTFRTAEK